MILSLDTEIGGSDIRNGCRPFFISTCRTPIHKDGSARFWQWDVDPKTRHPIIPDHALDEVQEYLDSADTLVLHNTRFDFLALESIGIKIDHLWDKVEDTLVASHLYDSLSPHGLKFLALNLLGLTDEDESELQRIVNQARAVGRKHGWDIARSGHPHFPAQIRSPKAGWWVMDMWLPRAAAKAGYAKDDELWSSVCQRYAVMDAVRTIGLWCGMEHVTGFKGYKQELKDKGLYDLYEEQRDLLRTVYEMESNGASVRVGSLKTQLKHQHAKIESHTEAAIKTVASPRDKHPLNLSSNKDRAHVLYSRLGLPVIKRGKDGPSTAKDVIDELINLSKSNRATTFLRNFKARNEYTSIVRYLESYKLFSHQKRYRQNGKYYCYSLIHPSFNPTGTRTTRFSSSYPNLQNVSKKVKPCFWCDGEGVYDDSECPTCEGSGWANLSLRSIYGPRNGRIWVSADYSNIEMRILARLANVESFLDIFRSGESVHIAVARVMYGDSVVDDPDFKKTDLYRSIKNGNFSISYGAGQEKADATYKLDGAYEKLFKAFPDVDRFQIYGREIERHVRQTGQLETLGGYPLRVPEDKPYACLNYLVQGSAGVVMKRAMVRVGDWLRQNKSERDAQMIMTIHDELVFDLPKDEFVLDNVANLCYNMESPGDDFEIPLPVEPELHPISWAEGEDLTDWWNERKREYAQAA